MIRIRYGPFSTSPLPTSQVRHLSLSGSKFRVETEEEGPRLWNRFNEERDSKPKENNYLVPQGALNRVPKVPRHASFEPDQ